MTSQGKTPDSQDVARLCLHRWLSLALSDPGPSRSRGPRLLDPDQRHRIELAARYLAGTLEPPPGGLAPGEIPLSRLDAAPLLAFTDRPPAELAREYRRIFGLLVSRDCPANETEYCPQTFSVYRAHRMADIAGFYRAFGLEPSASTRGPERPDHIALELEFMAWLIAKRAHARSSGDTEGPAHAATCLEAERKFFTEHLAWWVPAFALALRRRADGRRDAGDHTGESGGFLGAVATLLAAFIGAERAVLRVDPPAELAAPRAAEDPVLASCGEACPG